jgi:glycosyltransferase involved in cell wall biosynthesis
MEEEVRAEAARLEVPAFFLGWREGTADLYPELDLLVLSSRNEGLPLVLIEALAAARPVAATPVGGVPSLINMGESPEKGGFVPAPRGLIFPIGDEEGLARALLWSLDHGPELTGMALAGQKHVLARHGREGFLQAHADLYRDLLGEAQ